MITIGLTVLNTEIVSRSLFGPNLIVSQGPQGKIGGSWLMVENVGFGMAINIELEFMDMLSREIDTIMPTSRTTVTGSVEGTRTVLIPRVEPDGSVVIFFAELKDPKAALHGFMIIFAFSSDEGGGKIKYQPVPEVQGPPQIIDPEVPDKPAGNAPTGSERGREGDNLWSFFSRVPPVYGSKGPGRRGPVKGGRGHG